VEIQDGKHLTFSLGNEEYGLPILKVKEIIGMMEITHVPQTPIFIKGVVNLRGKIIPIMDLRLKLAMKERDYNERTCIIVVEVRINDAKRLMGIVVDTVSEVINIQKSEIEPPPEYQTKGEKGFLTGMGKIKGKVVMLLNIEQIINCSEMVTLLNDMKGSLANV
jgi:purine-binding chemotaxis protein CheW